MEFGVVKSITIEKNMDGESDTRMIEVEVFSQDDDDVESPSTHGIDCKPVKGSRMYFANISQEFGTVILLTDPTAPAKDLEDGERETYAVDGTDRVATIRQKADGTVIITEGTEPVIKGTTFKGKYAAHTHSTAFGPSGPPIEPLTPDVFNDKVLV